MLCYPASDLASICFLLLTCKKADVRKLMLSNIFTPHFFYYFTQWLASTLNNVSYTIISWSLCAPWKKKIQVVEQTALLVLLLVMEMLMMMNQLCSTMNVRDEDLTAMQIYSSLVYTYLLPHTEKVKQLQRLFAFFVSLEEFSQFIYYLGSKKKQKKKQLNEWQSTN